MPEIRETYGLPRRVPFVFRVLALALAFPAVGVGLWLLLPHGAVGVAVLVVYVLAALGAGLWRLSTARALTRPPGRHPMPPPSTTPPSTS